MLSNLKEKLSRLYRWLLKALLMCFVVSIAWVIIGRFVPIYLTPLMGIRSIESVFKGKPIKNEKTWVSIGKISPNMIQAVVSSEDNHFLTHWGFSFKDINKAFWHNQKKNKKRIHGGSTISQQTAKNVFLWQHRSYFRKGLEAYFTLLIELIWGKERIMEVYLNVIEMGDGIYGIEAASNHYFGIHASELSKTQAASIAACLPNPRKYYPAAPSKYIQGRKAKILFIMNHTPVVKFHNKKQTQRNDK